MRLINLTPHIVNIKTGLGDILDIAPSGTVARIMELREGRGYIRDIDITQVRYDPSMVTGLPEPKKDVIYIVSTMVLSACPTRSDIFAPGSPIRDDNGNIIACEGLSCTPAYRPALRINVEGFFKS